MIFGNCCADFLRALFCRGCHLIYNIDWECLINLYCHLVRLAISVERSRRFLAFSNFSWIKRRELLQYQVWINLNKIDSTTLFRCEKIVWLTHFVDLLDSQFLLWLSVVILYRGSMRLRTRQLWKLTQISTHRRIWFCLCSSYTVFLSSQIYLIF